MRVVCWNMRRAGATSAAWGYLQELDPDIALLQEVGGVPAALSEFGTCCMEHAGTKAGGHQNFKTVVLAKAPSDTRLSLESAWPWVNTEIDRLAGNFVGCRLKGGNIPLNVFSVYSPAWPVARGRLEGIDVSAVKLKQNPDVWATELLWAGLKSADLTIPTLVGGDLNSSETFDNPKPRGNREILERMRTLGLTETLRHSRGELTPTFKNPNGGKVIHQLDHLFVSESLRDCLVQCDTGDVVRVFEENLSDHLPIVADFDLQILGSGMAV